MARRPASETRRAIRASIAGQALGAVLEQMLLHGGVLALLILALGGSKFQAGLGFTIHFLAQTIRVVAAPHVDVSRRKRFVLAGMAGSAVLSCGYFLVVPASAWLGDDAAVWYVLGVFTLSRLALHWGVTAWFPLLSEILPSRLRGRYFGRMRTAWRITTSLALVGAGWYLGEDPSPARFYPVLGIGVLLSFGRVALIARLPEVPPQREGPREPVVRNLRRPLSDPPFRRFLLFILLMAAPNAMAMPYLVPFLKRDLEFPSSVTLYAAVFLGVGSVISLLPWGKLADRLGNRLVFVLSGLARAAAYLVFALVPAAATHPTLGLATACLAFALLGVGTSGGGIAHTVRLMHVTPSEHRAPYMSLFQTTLGFCNAAAALVGGLILESVPVYTAIGGAPVQTTRLFLVAVLALILVSVLAVALLEPVREPRIPDATAAIVDALPGPLALPLIPLQQYMRWRDKR